MTAGIDSQDDDVCRKRKSDGGKKRKKAWQVCGNHLERCLMFSISLCSSVQVESSMMSEQHTRCIRMKEKTKSEVAGDSHCERRHFQREGTHK